MSDFMERLIRGYEARERAREEFQDADKFVTAIMAESAPALDEMFAEMPSRFVYTSRAGDTYLIDVHSETGEIWHIESVPTVKTPTVTTQMFAGAPVTFEYTSAAGDLYEIVVDDDEISITDLERKAVRNG